MTIHLVSSMASKHWLQAVLERWHATASKPNVTLTSLGGVEVAKRIEQGEVFDVVMLARNAIDRLAQHDLLHATSIRDVIDAGVSVAVKRGTTHAPNIATIDDFRRAVTAAPSLSYSTGPSGVHLQRLFASWGMDDELRAKTVQAPVGVPVGQLVAEGRAALGFQQLSELLHVSGLQILGPLPPGVQIMTTFSAGRHRNSPADVDDLDALIAFLASPIHDDLRRAHGLEPVAT